MALDPAKVATQFQAAVDRQIERLEQGETLLSPEEIAKELADAYFEYSKDATLPGADMTGGGDVSILESAFTLSDPAEMPVKIATGIANYWSSFNTPGIPAHGGTAVQSVTVNGLAVLPAFISAIEGSITTEFVPDAYEVFFSTIEAVVNTIPCVIVELIPPNGTPTPFPETIS